MGWKYPLSNLCVTNCSSTHICTGVARMNSISHFTVKLLIIGVSKASSTTIYALCDGKKGSELIMSMPQLRHQASNVIGAGWAILTMGTTMISRAGKARITQKMVRRI